MVKLLVSHENNNEGCLRGITHGKNTNGEEVPSKHPLDLYFIHRRVTEWGHFLVASINGERTPHDYRLPYEVDRVPRNATKLTDDQMEDYWHKP
jgi:hypothetical protein